MQNYCSKFDEDVDYEYADYGNVDYAHYAAAASKGLGEDYGHYAAVAAAAGAEGLGEPGASYVGDYSDLFSPAEAKSADIDAGGVTVSPVKPQVITTQSAVAAETPRKQPYSFVTPSVYDMFEGNSLNFRPADDDFDASDPIVGNYDYEALRL